jgi:hypothetical protein
LLFKSFTPCILSFNLLLNQRPRPTSGQYRCSVYSPLWAGKVYLRNVCVFEADNHRNVSQRGCNCYEYLYSTLEICFHVNQKFTTTIFSEGLWCPWHKSTCCQYLISFNLYNNFQGLEKLNDLLPQSHPLRKCRSRLKLGPVWRRNPFSDVLGILPPWVCIAHSDS